MKKKSVLNFLLLLCACITGPVADTYSQQFVTYDFTTATVTAAPTGYNQPNAGPIIELPQAATLLLEFKLATDLISRLQQVEANSFL